MSVDRSDFVVIGYNLDCKYYNEDIYDQFYDIKVGEISHIFDWMNGEYYIVGIPLVYDIKSYNGIPLTEFDSDWVKKYESYFKLVKEHIKEYFDLEVEPKILVFSHYT
jgi:hypothetical protein